MPRRACRLTCATGLALSVAASKGSPIVNLVPILPDWKGGAIQAMVLNGKDIAPGRDHREGQASTLDSNDTIV